MRSCLLSCNVPVPPHLSRLPVLIRMVTDGLGRCIQVRMKCGTSSKACSLTHPFPGGDLKLTARQSQVPP
ncbi:hypothetical protein SAMN05192539_103665 [Paraburkholderia diazotrophica]|uniref:Uncharacterized protein n=1 Tax=Paraburkholderia diazotrophica TaxID=667676 RepID=A0A1H7DX15_9BURK|nr:hypothetical protein SAMN05192539_103665 [Paraburkholderia diazotrophica]